MKYPFFWWFDAVAMGIVVTAVWVIWLSIAAIGRLISWVIK